MELLHGSKHIIKNPQYGEGKSNNDYGRAFYCTQDLEISKEWACSDNTLGFVNRYSLEENGLKVFDLSSGDYHILNWLSILIENRIFRTDSDVIAQSKSYLLDNFLPKYKFYDVIKGYRADDSYFTFANAFLNNALSLAQLEKAMRLGKLGYQIAIKSKKAFSRLAFLDYVEVDQEIYYSKFLRRDKEAREAFKRMSLDLSGIYMIDIIRQGWKNDDERLRHFLSR